jgi:hypothetical protein
MWLYVVVCCYVCGCSCMWLYDMAVCMWLYVAMYVAVCGYVGGCMWLYVAMYVAIYMWLYVLINVAVCGGIYVVPIYMAVCGCMWLAM